MVSMDIGTSILRNGSGLSKVGEWDHITVEIETIGPRMADRMLKRSEAAGFTNRKIRQSRIERYAAEMAAGRWGFTGEPIIIGSSGEVFNGQHRLLALIESGGSAPFLIVRGVDRSAFDAIDSGLPRQAGDVLGAAGYEHRATLAAVARWIWRHEHGGILGHIGRITFSNAQVVEIVKNHPGVTDSVALVHRDGIKALGPVSPMAFCHYLFARIDKADADRFFDDLDRGEGLTAADPVWHLRQRLISQRASHAMFRPEHLVILFFKTRNAMRSGTQIHRLSIGRVVSSENIPTLI